MKKLLLLVLGLTAFTTVHAQHAVVIERPGIFTDLANAATALVVMPAAAATGIVAGTVEAFKDVVTARLFARLPRSSRVGLRTLFMLRPAEPFGFSEQLNFPCSGTI